MKQHFELTGMSCSACSAHIEKGISKLAGIHVVQVNLLQNNMVVEYDESVLSDQKIIDTVKELGYGASLANEKNQTKKVENSVDDELSSMKFRLVLSFAFLIPLMYISMGHMMGFSLPSFLTGTHNAVSFGLTQMLLTLPILYVNRKYYYSGFKALTKGSANMDSLVAIGSVAAFSYGVFAIYRMGYGLGIQDEALVMSYHMDLYFESAAMILALITFGKFLETRSKSKTTDAIDKLIQLAPTTVKVIKNQEEVEVDIDTLVVGDIIAIRSGDKIPVDGVVTFGTCNMDESSITGESMPVSKQIDDRIISGTLCQNGYILFEAKSVGEDTTLSKIVELVQQASSSKAPIAKLADKVASIFVPTVMLISALTFIVWMVLKGDVELALSMAICVLVISCPCALGLATPTAIMVGTGKAAQYGILVKSAESLENLSHIDTVVLDKTGTITTGKPEVSDWIKVKENVSYPLHDYVYSLEKQSEHPLADALIHYCESHQAVKKEVVDFHAITGKGISGVIEGNHVIIGNQKMLHEEGIDTLFLEDSINTLASMAKTPLYLVVNQEICGLIGVADAIKENSKAAIQAFDHLNVEVIMLTGDHQKTADALKKQLGLKKVIANLLPQDKENQIQLLQQSGKKVLMIGDGVNDAPSLVRADVGMAIGAGTDIAIESADIVLMHSDLMDSVHAISLSKAVLKNIKENLFWAFFYNIIGIPLAAGCFYLSFGLKLNPMFAAGAMSLSSVFVVSNALRLRFFKVKQESKDIKNEVHEEKEEKQMKKEMVIEGMMCGHCEGRVKQALNAIDGVDTTIDLTAKKAFLTLTNDVSDEVLKKTVEDAGYQVVEIK